MNGDLYTTVLTFVDGPETCYTFRQPITNYSLDNVKFVHIYPLK